jgi:ABC-type sugar transport systems, permease components
VVYTVLFVPLSVGGGLFAAAALNRRVRGIRFYRLAVFVPVVVSTIATSIMFLWLFDPHFGLANWLLGKVGLGPFGFFASSSGALYSIITMTVWGWIGFDAIIYLAALQGVPQELLEAAAIDGARSWSIFRNITLPLLGPATLFLVVFSSINALQVFDEVYFLTKGGPGTATYVPVYYLFTLAFQQGIAGYAASIAYVLLTVILILTVIQLWVGKRMVYYAS